MRETFRAPFQIQDKADLGEGEFFGLAAAFGVEFDTPFGLTTVARGAFSKTLQEAGASVPILWQHDTGAPIGRSVALSQTDAGLEVHGRISDTTLGRDARTLARDGVLTDMSIGFEVKKQDHERDDDGRERLRVIREVRLFEISFVTEGANPGAKIAEANHATPAKTFADLVAELETLAAADPAQLGAHRTRLLALAEQVAEPLAIDSPALTKARDELLARRLRLARLGCEG